MLFALFTLLLACNDTMLAKVIETKPEIMVHPTELFFGHLESGHETEQELFSIINVGNATLHAEPILMDGSTRYSIPDYESEQLILQPGEILDVLVDYTPLTYEHNGAVVKVISNDEENEEIFVIMEGYGDAPKIEVTPEYVDYGDISIGCDNEYRVTIKNAGNLDLIIDEVIQMSTLPNDVYIDYGSLPEPPWTLIQGQEVDLLVKYTPTDVGPDESIVKIISNDPRRNELEISQVGVGDIEHWIVEEWVQEEERIYDILWVIDNSGSMRRFQNLLKNNISSFVSQLLAPGNVDYRMGFITTDWHRLVDYTYIDINSQNPEVIAASIVDGIGTGGSANEQGLAQVHYALEFFKDNNRFIRSDAELVIIYVSDEPDVSPFPHTHYETEYQNFKPIDKIKAYAIIGDYPGGCNASFGNFPINAQFGSGYYELTNFFGGQWYSICDVDWGVNMTNLAADISIRSHFYLAEPDPIIPTLEVYVNGQLSLSGWSYDAAENKVIFEPNNIPSPGQTIRIEYATYGCGSQ